MDYSRIRTIIFILALTVVGIFTFYIVRPLLYPIFWAAVIASIVYPLHKKLVARIKFTNLSAAIVLLIVAIAIVLPLVILSSLLIKESADLYGALGQKSGQINNSVQGAINWIKYNSLTNRLQIDESFWTEKISETVAASTDFILGNIRNLTANSLTFMLMFVIMLYSLFYFIRDGAKILRQIMHLSPLGDRLEMTFYKKFTSTARAVIKGSLLIGLIQGTLGSLLFYVVGINGALVWGVIMMIFAIMIGSYFVWIPAGIIMLLVGNVWQGVLILVVGALVIGTIDNFLRPILVGRDTQMHPLLIFLSTLGGVLAFGISGLVIGPVITALLLSFGELYEHYYKEDLSRN